MAAELVVSPRQARLNVAETLTAEWYDDNGVLVDPGVVTVGVVDDAGNTIVAAGTATSGSGAAARTYALAAQTELDILTVTWTSATYGALVQVVEVVGEFLFTVREARTWDGSALASTSSYTAAQIDEMRARITDEFEALTGVSFIPRYRRETVSVTQAAAALYLPHQRVRTLRRVEYREAGAATWTAFTSDELADVLVDPWGRLTRETDGDWTAGTRHYRITYEHGWDHPPLAVKQAALIALRHYMVAGNLSDRTISVSTEFGTQQLWTPGISGRGSAIHPLPEVDRVLRLYAQTMPVVA